jgi:hypothetical protein
VYLHIWSLSEVLGVETLIYNFLGEQFSLTVRSSKIKNSLYDFCVLSFYSFKC